MSIIAQQTSVSVWRASYEHLSLLIYQAGSFNLDLGQSENSCPSSISIPRTPAFYAKDWSKLLIFRYFKAGFY